MEYRRKSFSWPSFLLELVTFFDFMWLERRNEEGGEGEGGKKKKKKEKNERNSKKINAK